MRLRKLKPEDAAAVAALSTQMGYAVAESDVAARLDAIGGRADLHGLVVDEMQRGLGIGRALIGEAAELAFKHHCTRLRVRTNVIRLRAGDFYRRAGFKEVKRQLVLDLPLAGTEAQS